MVNLSNQPEGSSIEVRDNFHDTILSWKNTEELGCARWGPAAFLSFWLIGWAFGEVAVVVVLKGMIGGHGRGNLSTPVSWGIVLFLLAWLGGWTIGGIAAMRTLRSLICGGRPESVTLGPGKFCHNPGVPIPSFMRGGNNDIWRTSKSNLIITISRRDMPALVLDWAGDRQRLSFDYGAERIEIGKNLREPDREWLADVIEDWRRSS
jgi:hypothetical protein